MDTQELELLDGFRRLCPTDRNMVMTAVSMVLYAKDVVRRQYGMSRKCPICGAEKYRSNDAIHLEKSVQEIKTETKRRNNAA